VSAYDDLPVADGPDPIGDDDPIVLRTEILRLRESLLAANGRTEVLRDRIIELERREDELDAANTALDTANTALHSANVVLHEELGRGPVMRVARAVRRQFRRAS
jgi:hypothetical protein